MHPDIKQLLLNLPPLHQADGRACKICSHNAHLFDVLDFHRCMDYAYEFSGICVPYYQCNTCGFIFTNLIDDWTIEETARFIYNDDYIKVDAEYLEVRPVETAMNMARLLKGCEELRILDYGSGAGKFATELASHGYLHVECYDPFSSKTRPSGYFDIITCFEVVEHSPKPLETFLEMRDYLAEGGAILVGQQLQPNNIHIIKGGWEYIMPRNGHVSLFTEETFMTIADKIGLIYHRGFTTLYSFTQPSVCAPIGAAIERIGHPVHSSLRLWAPISNNNDPDIWHGLEDHNGQPFRWLGKREVAWPEHHFKAGHTTIRIPFVYQIREHFASECRILIDGKIVPTQAKQNAIYGDLVLEQDGFYRVTLSTPDPISPMELRGVNDDRRLGLAIMVEPK